MDKKEILDKLRIDEHYYGTFGNQYLSNSNISTLLNNPLQLGAPSKQNPNFLVGGYFHTDYWRWNVSTSIRSRQHKPYGR